MKQVSHSKDPTPRTTQDELHRLSSPGGEVKCWEVRGGKRRVYNAIRTEEYINNRQTTTYQMLYT